MKFGMKKLMELFGLEVGVVEKGRRGVVPAVLNESMGGRCVL
jgi:hypothetical protein